MNCAKFSFRAGMRRTGYRYLESGSRTPAASVAKAAFSKMSSHAPQAEQLIIICKYRSLCIVAQQEMTVPLQASILKPQITALENIFP